MGSFDNFGNTGYVAKLLYDLGFAHAFSGTFFEIAVLSKHDACHKVSKYLFLCKFFYWEMFFTLIFALFSFLKLLISFK